MKHGKLIRYLGKHGAYLLREGAKHSVYYNPENGKISTIPRHSDVKKFTAQKICKDLEIVPLRSD
jgi:mRNA interferase HicA